MKIDPQPFVQIDPVKPAGLGNGAEHGREQGSPGGAKHRGVVAAHDGIAQALLHAVIVHGNEGVVHKEGEFSLAVQGTGFTELVLIIRYSVYDGDNKVFDIPHHACYAKTLRKQFLIIHSITSYHFIYELEGHAMCAVESVKVEVINPNPPRNRLWVTLYRMPPAYGHYMASPSGERWSQWGRKHVIAFLMDLSKMWPYKNTHRFGIGDICRQQSHESHFAGSAVDIYVIHKDGVERKRDNPSPKEMVTWSSTNYDFEKTHVLAELIAKLIIQRYGAKDDKDIKAQKGVHQYLYNDEKIQRSVQSTPPISTKKQPSHDDHIHLTFLNSMLTDRELSQILETETDLQRAARELEELVLKLLADLRLLMYGSCGATVEALQALLNNQGASRFPRLEEDGVFGPKTRARVQEFQQCNNLLPDGVVGPETKKTLADKYK